MPRNCVKAQLALSRLEIFKTHGTDFILREYLALKMNRGCVFQMSPVNLTNGNYIRILMPDCCFIRLIVGYHSGGTGIIRTGAAEIQEGRGSSSLLLLSYMVQLCMAFGRQQGRKRAQTGKMCSRTEREACASVWLRRTQHSTSHQGVLQLVL